MKRVFCFMFFALLAIPAARGDDPPKEDKKPPKEQYQALVKEFTTQQRAIIQEAQKVKGADQAKLYQKYTGLGREFAEKFYALAEENSKDPAATDALFWIVQNGVGSPVHAKASERVTAIIAEMPLKDLLPRLNGLRIGMPAVVDAVLKRAEKDENSPQAGDLLAWIATTGSRTPAGKTAMTRLIEKYPDHPAIERICMVLARDSSAKGAETLKQIMEKSTKPSVKAAAAVALGQGMSARLDALGDKQEEADKVAAEAETYFNKALDILGKENPAKTKSIEKELRALRSLRVGKEALEIVGPDLDGKEFKLSDYRGKVVLLDFWGNW